MAAGGGDIVLAFDVYGTLLSTESIAKKLAAHFGEDRANAVSAKWRVYQLEYTWRLNSMGLYEPFSEVTQRALRHALKENKLSLSQADMDALMEAYNSLSTFPDVDGALTALAKEDGVTAVAFSQGTHAMVSASLTQSPDLKPHAALFKETVTVDTVRKFKPAPEVYYYLAERMGKAKTREGMAQLWLVSGNPFDVAGAKAVGMKAAWVDRAGNGWVDCLGEGPDVVVQDLKDVVVRVREASGGGS